MAMPAKGAGKGFFSVAGMFPKQSSSKVNTNRKENRTLKKNGQVTKFKGKRQNGALGSGVKKLYLLQDLSYPNTLS